MVAGKSKEPLIPISYGSTELIETGKWSSRKPQTLQMIPPCQEACPAGTDISLFVRLVQQGRHQEALATILMENPFPGVCGRVCFHPCEAGCNRAHYDESVSIQTLERFVAGLRHGKLPLLQPGTANDPRRIGIVGSGPAGLSCAYFLALLGHRPTVFEAKDDPGGVMRWGIPEFRLPKPVLKKEIRRILALPVELRTGCRVGRDITFDELGRFDAIFLSPARNSTRCCPSMGKIWLESGMVESFWRRSIPARVFPWEPRRSSLAAAILPWMFPGPRCASVPK